MDQVVESYVANGEFMGSVLVARGGEVLFPQVPAAATVVLELPGLRYQDVTVSRSNESWMISSTSCCLVY
jgi:hypothetical protein